jgi:hypothetical protein
MSISTLWSDRPPPKRKKKPLTADKSYGCRSIDHSQNLFPHQSEKQDDSDKPGWTGTL